MARKRERGIRLLVDALFDVALLHRNDSNVGALGSLSQRLGRLLERVERGRKEL